jgi:hypothetical protein
MAHSYQFIQQVWEKGSKVAGKDESIWRKDACGSLIKRSEYGNRSSDYGWEIDRISAGGEYILSNCRPLQWENNVAKSNGRLKC